jgi:hypothetical protein
MHRFLALALLGGCMPPLQAPPESIVIQAPATPPPGRGLSTSVSMRVPAIQGDRLATIGLPGGAELQCGYYGSLLFVRVTVSSGQSITELPRLERCNVADHDLWVVIVPP